MSFTGLQLDHVFSGGFEEAFLSTGMFNTIDQGVKWFADQFGYLRRTFRGLYPGICSDTRVGCTDFFTEPVVVLFVYFINKNKAGLCEVVGGGHDRFPQTHGFNGAIDFTRHQPLVVGDHAFFARPVEPQHFILVVDVDFTGLDFFLLHRKGELPRRVITHGLNEVFGDQQRQIELTQSAVFPLGANEFEDIGVAYIKRGHLCAATTAGRGDGETHFVVDIHERQWPGGVGAGTGDIGTARAQGREVIANAAAGLQGQARFVDLAENVVHGVADGAGDGAVNGGGGGLVLACAGVGNDAAGRDRTLTQGPDKFLEPVLFLFFGVLDFSQGSGHALKGRVEIRVYRFAFTTFQPVFLVPDIQRGILQRNADFEIRLSLAIDGDDFSHSYCCSISVVCIFTLLLSFREHCWNCYHIALYFPADRVPFGTLFSARFQPHWRWCFTAWVQINLACFGNDAAIQDTVTD